MQVDGLQAQLTEKRVSPPDGSSSEEGSEKSAASGGFVKIGMPLGDSRSALLEAKEEELQRREAAVAEREESLQRRELEMERRSHPAGEASEWHGALLLGLSDVCANLRNVELAAAMATGGA